jgi:DNA-binding transcriptional LysR family regulator
MPNATCEAVYMMTAVGMIRAGLGPMALPGSAREIKTERGLRSKQIDDPTFTRPVSIIKRSGRALPPLSQAFLEHLAVCLSAPLAQIDVAGAYPATKGDASSQAMSTNPARPESRLDNV